MKKIVILICLSLINSIYAVPDGWDQATKISLIRMGQQVDEEFDQASAYSEIFARNTKFSCPIIKSRSTKAPDSVHRLKYGDIDVVGAIGDSLTAANGAKAWTVVGVLTEDRGVAWSIGGETNDINKLVTLPNILRKYNPNIHGFSTSSVGVDDGKTFFNHAQPGHTSFETLDQAKALVDKMKKSTQIDFYNQWKMVTFFIGGNDLCKACKDPKYSVTNYVKNVQDTLDYFHQNLPRTIVNLVLTLDVSGIEPLSTGLVCPIIHDMLCSCGLSKSYRTQLKSLVKGMQQDTEELIKSGRYDTRDDFTVVVQPFMKTMEPPKLSTGKPDHSYFAPDCFHFSSKGHGAAAIELWSNLITPVGKKSDKWTNLGSNSIPCPTSEFIYTNINSKF